MPSSWTCYEQMVNRWTQVHTIQIHMVHATQVQTIQIHIYGRCDTEYTRCCWRLPWFPSPHCRHQLPKHSICRRPPQSLWHQYGDNYYPNPVAINLSPHLPDSCPGHLFPAKSCSVIIYFSSSSQHSSSSLVRGFRVGPTPVIRKIVGEEKEGI